MPANLAFSGATSILGVCPSNGLGRVASAVRIAERLAELKGARP